MKERTRWIEQENNEKTMLDMVERDTESSVDSPSQSLSQSNNSHGLTAVINLQAS